MTASRELRRGAVALLALVACGESTPRRADSTSGAASAPPSIGATPTATMGPDGCLRDGTWRPCGLVDRLERSGLVVQLEPDTVRYEFIDGPGLHYTVGRGDVHAFFYADTARLRRDLDGIDTARVAPKGTVRHWDAHPTLVHSANLLLIVLTGNDHLTERVQLAVEAGAPQPEPPAVAQPLAPVKLTP